MQTTSTSSTRSPLHGVRWSTPSWKASRNPMRTHNRRDVASGDFSEHQGRVLRSEGNAVAHRMFDRGSSPLSGDIIEITFRIDILQVNRGRYLLMMHGDER